jgi:curli biogenesis system outer membrane secretion channel CsgG
MTQRLMAALLGVLLLPIMPGCPKPKTPTNTEVSNVKSDGYSGKKAKIIVVEFDNNSYNGYSFGDAATKMLSSALVNTQRYSVIEKDNLREILQQQGFQNSGLTEPGTAAKIGKILNAKYIVKGDITEISSNTRDVNASRIGVNTLKYKAVVDIVVVDVETGETVIAVTGDATLTDRAFRLAFIDTSKSGDFERLKSTLRDAIDKTIPQIIPKMPFAVLNAFKIANVQGGKITVAASGELKVGDKLRVTRRTKEVTDPDTGSVIDFETEEVGVIEVVEVKGKVTYCKIVSGTGFAAGDVVEPQ